MSRLTQQAGVCGLNPRLPHPKPRLWFLCSPASCLVVSPAPRAADASASDLVPATAYPRSPLSLLTSLSHSGAPSLLPKAPCIAAHRASAEAVRLEGPRPLAEPVSP